ncbi:MAG: ATP-dependent helicase, partial [Candidatus Methylomirabilales bacterium]
VDEFQDTNYAQLQLVKLLASKYRNLCVVGDDDQSIFRFRGASFSNILVFLKEYPDAQTIVLSENYRSTQPILDAAYRLIQHNNPDRLEVEAGIDKRLVAKICPEQGRRDGSGSPVQYKIFGTYEDEADWVAETIAEKAQEGIPYREFAILVRRNADADPFIRSLNMKGIPWRFSGSRGLYDREEIRTVMAFLRALADPHDSKSLYHLASSEVYGMPAMDLTVINAHAARTHQSLFEVFRRLTQGNFEEAPDLDKVSGLGLAAAKRLIEDLDRYIDKAVREPTGSVLYEYLVKQPGYVKRLSQSSSFQDHQKVANIAKFFEIVRRYSEVASYDRVAHFVEYLDQLIEAGDDPAMAEFEAEEDAVSILTLHKAKGLEFAVIFLVGLVHNRFPSPERGDPIPLPDELMKDILPKGDFHLEEERRLFYVGMTRAKQELYLTRARDYGTKREWKASPFILEALDLPKAPEEVIRASAQAAIDRSAPLPNPAGEGNYTIPADQPLELSYYRIDDYLTCPLKYWYTHIQRMERILRRHHTVIYGSAIHQAVREYHVRKVQGERMSLEDLYAAFERAWISEGFISRRHEEERLRAGREALAWFFRHAEAEPAAPTYIERKFRFKLDNDWIIGYWDRVDERDGEVVIIDYKTSELREQKKADEETRKSPQLSIYALAYRERFGKLPDRVELRFLTPWGVLIGRAVKKEKDLEKTIEKIREASIGIRSGRFPAKPSEWVCRFCAYQSICPATAWKEVEV